MDDLQEVIREVEARCRGERVPMLGPEKAGFLRDLVISQQPSLVLECGTAIGYSGLFIADGLRASGRGRLITVEIDPDRSRTARSNFERAGVGGLVDAIAGDAVEVLKSIDLSVDFLLLDNSFQNYFPCFQAIRRRLVDGATIVADNAEVGKDKMADYLTHVRSRYRSETRAFEVNLPWLSHDAMEVTEYRTD
jgi:predicted O-methyltransferase YrrM